MGLDCTGLGLAWDLRIVLGVANTEEGLRRVGGAILTVEDQTLEVGFDCFLSSSVVVDDDGGGRSPYNPPNIVKVARDTIRVRVCEICASMNPRVVFCDFLTVFCPEIAL